MNSPLKYYRILRVRSACTYIYSTSRIICTDAWGRRHGWWWDNLTHLEQLLLTLH